jgi:hypothetical protein
MYVCVSASGHTVSACPTPETEAGPEEDGLRGAETLLCLHCVCVSARVEDHAVVLPPELLAKPHFCGPRALGSQIPNPGAVSRRMKREILDVASRWCCWEAFCNGVIVLCDFVSSGVGWGGTSGPRGPFRVTCVGRKRRFAARAPDMRATKRAAGPRSFATARAV